MSGLKRRLSRRRSAGPEGSEPTAAAPGPGATPNQTPAEPEAPTSLLSDPAAPAPVQPAPQPFSAGPAVPGAPYSHLDPSQPPAVPVADLPPGLDPDELSAVPTTSARRGRLRKRVAFLRAARELLLRDLGGFVYEIHRTAGDHEHEAHRRLRATKLDRLTRVDAELHELELLLDDVRRNVVVSEPGVGGECPECGELFGSAAHYCSHCGLPLTESARRALARVIAGQPGPVPAKMDQPTQELPPLPAAPGTEFHWPPREAKAEGQTAGGEGAATGGAAAEWAGVEGGTAATAADAPATTDATATDVDQRAAAGGDAAAQAAPGDAAAVQGAPGGEGETAASAETTGGEEAAKAAKTPRRKGTATTGGEEPAKAAKTPRRKSASTAAKTPRGKAGAAGGAPPADTPPAGDAPNGSQPASDDLVSRAERGT